MTSKEDRTLRMYYARLARYDWEDKMAYWDGKHKEVRNDSRLLEIKSASLIHSLLSARASFFMPAGTDPHALCAATQPEVDKLLRTMGDMLKTHGILPAMTPKQLFRNLEGLAWKLIGESFGKGNAMLMNVALPPGFDSFVSRWLTRAVNNVVGTQGDDDSDKELMEMVNEMQRTKIDPRTADVESDLEEIMNQFGQTSLEGALGGEDVGVDGDDTDEEGL